MDKTKFVRDPQLDAEGFTMLDAPCCGCGPCEPCPRSGHCERYSSPLRYLDYAVPQIMLADVQCTGCAPIDVAWTHSETDVLYREITGRNPRGWDAVDGVQLPSVSPWAQLDQSHLDAVHDLWSAGKVTPQLSNEATDRKINAMLSEHGTIHECPRTDACANLHHIECGCIALADAPMPWCDPCQCYHHTTARCINKASA